MAYLVHDHVLYPLALLALPLLPLPCPLDHRLEELEELDVSLLLDAVDEVLDLRLSHLAAQVRVVSEYLCQRLRLHYLMSSDTQETFQSVIQRCVHLITGLLQVHLITGLLFRLFFAKITHIKAY